MFGNELTGTPLDLIWLLCVVVFNYALFRVIVGLLKLLCRSWFDSEDET